jgi:hypothetical protein
VKPETIARAERVLDQEAVSWTRVESGGWSRNEHWTFLLADGTRAFAKVASIDPGPAWLRDEFRVYSCVAGSFMPRFLGWEDGDEPLLVLEDIADAYWPPPWRDGDVDAVLAALAEVGAATWTDKLPALAGWPVGTTSNATRSCYSGSASSRRCGWGRRCRSSWRWATAPLAGGSLLHCDVRSDNLCLRDGRATLVDWNHARIGNPALDVAFWLPSLELEGGPPPDPFGVDEFAPLVAGFFDAHAGLPPPEGAPKVRDFQRAQLEVALPWACRALGLPPPS